MRAVRVEIVVMEGIEDVPPGATFVLGAYVNDDSIGMIDEVAIHSGWSDLMNGVRHDD